MVLKCLTDHMSINNLHCSNQFGYKKHHSTEILLLEIVDETLMMPQQNSATVVILLDMNAAFDTVGLQKLIIKESFISGMLYFLNLKCIIIIRKIY